MPCSYSLSFVPGAYAQTWMLRLHSLSLINLGPQAKVFLTQSLVFYLVVKAMTSANETRNGNNGSDRCNIAEEIDVDADVQSSDNAGIWSKRTRKM